MQLFVQTYLVQAEAAPKEDGRPGYDVYYPDGRVEWIPAADFDLHHRLLDTRERMVFEMSNAEIGVMRISDKEHREPDP